MKKFTYEEENFRGEITDVTLVIGTAKEIRNLYKQMLSHGYFALYCDFPKFNMDKMYGLTYEGNADTFDTAFYVVSGDTALRIISEMPKEVR